MVPTDEEARPDPPRPDCGSELATRLSETIEDAVCITLLDRNDSFFFSFSKRITQVLHVKGRAPVIPSAVA